MSQTSTDPNQLPSLISQLTDSVGQLTCNQHLTQQRQYQIMESLHTMARPPGSTGLEKVAQGLKPPQFSGERDSVELDTWLFQVEEYFLTLPNLDESSRVRAAGLMLKGQAASWYRDIMRREQTITTWADFRQAISLMFMPIGRDKQARIKLDHTVQRAQDSVATYTTYMRRLILAIGPGVSEDERLYRFVKGLRDPIREHVYMKEPKTFDEACQLATRYEAMRQAFQKGTKSESSQGSGSRGPAPMELGAVQAQAPKRAPNFKSNNNKTAKTEGKCLYCQKPGHYARDCRKKAADKKAKSDQEKAGHRQDPSPSTK